MKSANFIVHKTNLFRRDLGSFLGDGAFHEENESDERDGNNRKDKECVEVGECR